MSIRINPRAQSLKIPGTRQFSNQLVHYPDAINLTIGQPDFPTPLSVKEAGIRAIEQNLTGYSHNAGLLELRNAVNSFFSDKYGFSYDIQNEIVITNGASEAIDAVFRTILEEGDEVILPAPTYSGYVPVIELCGAKVVYLDTTDTNFQPSAERLANLITDKTKAMFFNNPSNPTGVVLTKETMDGLVDVIKEKNIFVLTDEIYSENTFSGKHHSFASYMEIRDKLFYIHGVSKSHSMTGWRIGFLMGPASVMEHVVKVHAFNTICASLPAQHAAIEALTNAKDTPTEMNFEYVKRRDFVYSRLTDMGVTVEKPNGAFYIFPEIKKYGLNSFDFATKLLQEGGVAVVPGSAFTTYGEGYIRISYAYSMTVLEEGLNRLEKFLFSLNK
ncbi:aminotransferase class I/II-fold pyridoxal phosphate-dependent enzyme [Psychrobacillus sp. FSL K6-2365]|uniref:aminotransferase class I/II-fold pyridoxal phosphate-dependent enzyme n=1 Tax=Psychrobacillus TaxID=1221880 RepID=UPI0008F21710|nr:aminotransferase class I/II-fold pyridoxal phosphate-dependent enzyme [Psychrobacillus psychrodurans]MCZ8542281.1 aminotransferase class I/II-fold pyridoxal phosphate-dependent enzyme [Psychrobacillus psychrodurans]SFN20168.1 aminotransferase [Psychrobacillus psychrodurans]